MPSDGSFSALFDIGTPEGLERSRRCRDYWGKLHTEIVFLDREHVLMVFRPAPDPRWRAWESVRKGWIKRLLADQPTLVSEGSG